jgi:hypothetical protein
LPWLRPNPLNPFNPWLIFILAVAPMLNSYLHFSSP